MKKGIIVLIAVLAVVVLIIGSFIGTYNSLVAGREKVNQYFSTVQVQYQRRADLIPNLVETVKGYSAFESNLLTKVTEARAGISAAKTPSELNSAGASLNKVIGDINVVVEAYPELKANTTYISLMDELAGTENRVSVARTDYNKAAQTFNSSIQQFPTNIVAGIFNFEKFSYFEAAQGSENAPQVKF